MTRNTRWPTGRYPTQRERGASVSKGIAMVSEGFSPPSTDLNVAYWARFSSHAPILASPSRIVNRTVFLSYLQTAAQSFL